MFKQTWVAVSHSSNLPTAQSQAAFLEERGIPCFVEGGALADELATSRHLSGIEIKVHVDCLQQARTLLTELARRHVGRAEIACPSCGEKIEAAFDACWKCGQDRPAEASASG